VAVDHHQVDVVKVLAATDTVCKVVARVHRRSKFSTFFGGKAAMKRLISRREEIAHGLTTQVTGYRIALSERAMEVRFANPIDIWTDVWLLAAIAVEWLGDSHHKDFEGFTFQSALQLSETEVRNGRAIRCIFRSVSRDEYYGGFRDVVPNQ
jgi:hypothetical protein